MKRITFLITSIFFISCDRPELRVNSYFAKAVLIDREFCPSDSSQNYWVFNITTPYGDSTMRLFGEKIKLNDTTYNRVVKVRSLPNYTTSSNDEYKPVYFNQKYILELEVFEDSILSCFHNTNLNSVPEVNVKQLSLTN